MGRLIALVLGGLALALYLPPFFVKEPPAVERAAEQAERNDFERMLVDTIGAPLTDKLKGHGAGVFAGLALILLAVRGHKE